MDMINLKESTTSKPLGMLSENSRCTCTECGICVACIVFAPTVVIALTGALLGTLMDIMSPVK